MARLTDSSGALLGGLEMPLSRLLASLNGGQAAPITVPHAPPPPAPAYGPGEIVFALHCAHGSLPSLGYSAPPPLNRGRKSPRLWGCDTLIEEPEERHYCPACGGYYCHAHADTAAHQCRSLRRSG